jgi:hypothetical protein
VAVAAAEPAAAPVARLLFLCTGNSAPGPATSGDDDEATLPAFRELAAEVETRVAYLLASLGALPG